MTSDPAVRTRALAKIVGPYFVIMAAALILRAATLDLLLPAFMQDGPLVLAAGAFTLVIGLTIIALHHHFTNPAAAAVSLIGIAAAVKGAMLMLAPDFGAPLTAIVVRAPPALLIAAALVLVIGLWLTFVGWLSRSRIEP